MKSLGAEGCRVSVSAWCRFFAQRASLLGWAGCLVFILSVCLAAQTWTSLGPTNEAGVIRSLHLHRSSNKLFGAAHDGGLWVTDLDDTTQSWSPISDFLDNIEIRAFGVVPSNASVIYVANKTFRLYRTSNGGASWTQLTSFNETFGRVNRIVVPVDRPTNVFLATTTGIYRSINSGQSWSLMRGGDAQDLVIDPDNSQIMYTGVRLLGVFKTVDGGATWFRVLEWTEASNTNNNLIPPRTTPSQVIRISLGVRRPNGFFESPETRTVAVKFGKHVWISNNSGGLFSNRDSPLITQGDAGNYRRSEDLVDDEWCNAIEIDPWNSNRILVGQTFMFMTTDRGLSWLQFNATADSPNRFSHEDFQDIEFSHTVQNLIFAANDGGVERSTAASPTFSKFYTNLVTAQLVRAGVAGNTVVANSDHNGILGNTAITDGTWSQVISSACGYGNNGMERSDVYEDPKRPGRFYFLFTNQIGRVNFPFQTGSNCENNASRFSPFVPFLNHPFPEKPQQSIAIDTRANSQLILAAADLDRTNCGDWLICPQGTGNTFNLMLTRNGDREPTGTYGADDPRQPAWEVTAQSVDDPFVSVAFVPRTTGKNAYAITRSGALYTASIPVSPPAVINWTRQNGFVPAGAEGVRHLVPHPASENTIYAITKNSFARTSNGGVSWTVQNNPIPSSSYYSIVHDTNFVGGTELYVGTSDGVYKGTFPLFGGILWTKINGNLPNVKVVQLVRDGVFLYAVTFGRGLWRLSLADNIGISELDPVESTVSTDERFGLAVKWTHPERWRLLDKIEVRLVDDQGTAIWVRFDEATNTFRPIDPGLGPIGRPAQPGTATHFVTETAVMYLADSQVQGSGPTGPDVTLKYDLSFRPAAAGRTFRVEVLATDDAGNRQGFEQIGSVTVRPVQDGGEGPRK